MGGTNSEFPNSLKNFSTILYHIQYDEKKVLPFSLPGFVEVDVMSTSRKKTPRILKISTFTNFRELVRG